MRKQIILEWDTDTGFLYDAKNVYIGSNLQIEPFEPETKSTSIEDLVKLRNAGFATDEIIELKRKELI
jgi:hypothetical protein